MDQARSSTAASWRFVWYPSESGGTNTNLRLSEAYLDVDIRDRPTVSGVTATGRRHHPPDRGVDLQRQHRRRPADPVPGQGVHRRPVRRGRLRPRHQPGHVGLRAQARVDRPTTSSASTWSTAATYKVYVAAAQDFNRCPWYGRGRRAGRSRSTSPHPPPPSSRDQRPDRPESADQLQYTATLNALAADDADLEVTLGTGSRQRVLGVARPPAQARNGAASVAVTCQRGRDPVRPNGGNSGVGGVASAPA